MSIPVQCPACQHAFAVADRFAGKKGKCPKCGMIFKAELPAAGSETDLDVFPEVPPPSDGPTPAVPAPKRLSTRQAGPPAPIPLAPADGGRSPYDSGPVETFPTVPMGTAVPLAAPAQPAFAVGSESGEHRLHGRRAKRSPLPLIIGGSVAGLTLLGIMIGVVWTLGGDSEQAVAKKTDDSESSAAPDATATETPPTTPAPPAASAAPAIDTSALAPLRQRVLRLEIKTPQATKRAVCFLVADHGYAVAPWHALAQAVSVEAITADDVRIPVAGTAAIDVGRDLAIIKLEPTLPVPLEKIELNTADPGVNTDLAGLDVALPAPVVTGKFKSTDSFAKLSPTVRARLKGVHSEWADDTGVVLHSLKLSSDSSGAPLLSAEGRVIGMHVASDVSSSLAVHVRHIASLLESAGSNIQPFAGAGVASTDTPPSVAPMPMPMPMPEAAPAPMPEPRPEDPIDDLVARIKEHRDACDKLGWSAEDPADYAQFQLLAKFVNEAATQADAADTSEEAKEKLQAAVREAMFSLTADKWPDEDAWKQTNEQAAKGLETPGEGVFALTRVVVTSDQNMLGDVPIALVEIVGESKMLVLPLATGGEKLGVGDQVLVLGMHDPTIAVQFRNANVPLVRTKYVLAVEPQD